MDLNYTLEPNGPSRHKKNITTNNRRLHIILKSSFDILQDKSYMLDKF